MGELITNVGEYEKDFRKMAFGQYTFDTVTADDAPAEAVYRVMVALTDTEVTFTQKLKRPLLGPETLSLLAGTTIFGVFETVESITGTMILYQG